LLGQSLNRLYNEIGLSKQAVQQHRKRQSVFEEKLAHLIVEAQELRAEHPGCGVEKMYDTLRPNFLGRDKFIRIFMDLGFRVVHPKNYTKTTFPTHYDYPNLIQGMLVTRINQVVQSDICYFLIGDVFYYLVFITDVFSKRIVAYEASNHLRATANLAALQQLIRLRGKQNLNHTIHHSDRGSQYGATKYVSTLNDLGCHISMGLTAQDNAYAERVNGIIKNEYLNLWKINSFCMLKRKLKQAVDHYNHKRPHCHLPPKMSPVQFELALADNKLDKEHFELIFAKENHLKRPFKELLDFPSFNCPDFFCPVFLS
jgi:putative transposase